MLKERKLVVLLNKCFELLSTNLCERNFIFKYTTRTKYPNDATVQVSLREIAVNSIYISIYLLFFWKRKCVLLLNSLSSKYLP